MERDVPFDEFRTSRGLGDYFIIFDLRRCYHALEVALDELPGKAMDMLRLERFMFWYDEEGNTRYVGEWTRTSN